MAIARDPYSGEFQKGGGGGGMAAPDDPDYFAKLYGSAMRPAAGAPAAARRRAEPAGGMLNPRRGLLLTPEQIAGPPAPAYLLRGAYVYGRQNLL